MTPIRPYLATLTLTTLATIWAGSAIVQRERRIEILKTAAARSGDKQLSAREAGNSEDVLMTLTEKPEGSEERLRPTTPIDQRREGLTASVSYDQSGTRIAAIKRGRQSSDLYEVTAYHHGCVLPKNGIEGPPRPAADGSWPIAGRTVAADWALHPPGSELLIAGRFWRVTDKGRAIKGRRVDLFVTSCKQALRWGRQRVEVVAVPAESTAFDGTN